MNTTTDMTTPEAALPPIDYALLAKHLGPETANLLCITRWYDGIDIEEPCSGTVRLLQAYALAALQKNPDHLDSGVGGGVTQWQPIETAPECEVCIVHWLDADDKEHPDRYMFDYLEEGLWQNFFNEHEHYLIAGAASGRSEDAPYTSWAKLKPPAAPTGEEA